MHIEGQVDRYNSERVLEKTSPKSKDHDVLGLDYISAILSLILDARNDDLPETINLISASGNLSSEEISFERVGEGYRISLEHENKQPVNALDYRLQHPLGSLGSINRSITSIVLNLDREKELTRARLNQDPGSIDIEIKKA